MTIKEAEKFFKACHCNHIGMYKDLDEPSKEYLAMKISAEQEEMWRIEEIEHYKIEVDKIKNIDLKNNWMVNRIAFLSEICNDDIIKENSVKYLFCIVKNNFLDKDKHILVFLILADIRRIVERIRNKVFKKENKQELLNILEKMTIFNFHELNKEHIKYINIQDEAEYRQRINQLIKDCKKL